MLKQQILELLYQFAQEHDPSRVRPPALMPVDDVFAKFGADMAGPILFDLEVETLVQSDGHDGHYFVGLHPATIRNEDGTFTLDPDLVCERCKRVQTFGCAMGTCDR